MKKTIKTQDIMDLLVDHQMKAEELNKKIAKNNKAIEFLLKTLTSEKEISVKDFLKEYANIMNA